MKTHEAILIHSDCGNLVEISQLACVEAKKKNHIDNSVYLTPVWHIHSPFGHVVIVELPIGREVEKALEVQGQKKHT